MQDQLVVVIRHGERRDYLPDAPSEVDPPLTEQGKREVEAAANRIREAIGPSIARRLVMLTSPFLRTLETAQELQRHGIGSDRASSAIDNTLCEVFGPTRIKASSPPNVIRKDAHGTLPAWGESIQFATTRFIDSFLRNAQDHPFENLILVSHGDAISAVLSQFYPRRMVYETEFLSFIVMKRSCAAVVPPTAVLSSSSAAAADLSPVSENGSSTSSLLVSHHHRPIAPHGADHHVTVLPPVSPGGTAAGPVRFTLLHSHGVQWLVDGDPDDEEDEEGTTAVPTTLHPHTSSGGPLSPLRVVVSSSRGTSVGGSPALPHFGSSRSAFPASEGPTDEEREAEERKQEKDRKRQRLLRILQVVSVAVHLPFLGLWPTTRDACIYLLTATTLELLSLRLGWRSVVDKLPFSYGSPRRRVLYRLARYPVTRTVWKWIVLFLVYMLVSIFTSLIVTGSRGHVSVSTFRSFATIGTNVWAALVVVLWFILETWKGYLQDEEDYDPHREAI